MPKKKKRRSKLNYYQQKQRCNYCLQNRHRRKTECLVNERWWKKQIDEKTPEKIPKKFSIPTLKDDGYYIWDRCIIPYDKNDQSFDPNLWNRNSYRLIYCIMDFVGGIDDDGKYHQFILDIADDSYDDRYLLSVVRLINNPRIMYFVLKYYPNILDQKIHIRSTWKDALLIQFVTNKKCCRMYDEYNKTINNFVNHISSKKIGCKNIASIISKFL